MSFLTRRARITDLEPLVAIENAVFAADRLSRRSFRTLLGRASALILVAEQAGRIAGYAAVLFRKASSTARLYSIAAAPGAAGVGRKLLCACEDLARGRGARSMRLEVREDNARAIGLYERSGYRSFGRKPNYYADGAAALCFSKVLEAVALPAPPG